LYENLYASQQWKTSVSCLLHKNNANMLSVTVEVALNYDDT